MKTIEEIYEGLLANFAERAGFTPAEDCDLAVRLYAAAAELQALGAQADWVLAQSFPQTAEGVYLDRHAALRSITRMAALTAAGSLRFSVSTAPASDLTIAAGTVCMTEEGVRFETAEIGTLAAGSLYTDVAARAQEAGAAGNAVAGTVTLLIACPTGITAVTNPAAFTGGADAEDDEALRTRILASYRRLPNGANAAFYEETALSHTGVVAARAVGRARGIGTVDVYLAAAAGTPDNALLSVVQSDLQSRREIAVDVLAKAPTVSVVNVTASIAVAEGYEFSSVKTAAEAAVSGLFTGKLLGKGVTCASLVHLLCGVEGVSNCHLTAPTADLTAADTVLPTLGTLNITELEA